MRYLTVLALMALVHPVAAVAQSGGVLDLSSLVSLESNAEETVSISFDPSTMGLAKAFLEGEMEDEAALEIIDGLESLQVRVFEFADAGYSADDIAPIYAQLDGSEWSQVLRIDEGDERVGAWLYQSNDAVGGMALIVEEDGELVVVNIVGSLSLEDIRVLGSEFGLPFLPVARSN